MRGRIQVVCFLHKVLKRQNMQFSHRVGFRIKYTMMAAMLHSAIPQFEDVSLPQMRKPFKQNPCCHQDLICAVVSKCPC